ncbi:abscisic acid receptor PYL3-like isoform X2 [Typha angustifolia]|uniref:abscisic acid receptor PYL3-like isoform X2 n=1 Tax=Typha angustifolia TaxID=59011 RepID=UPI003C2E59EE
MVGMKSGDRGGCWRLMDETDGSGSRAIESEYVRKLHRHEPRENQCSSTLVKRIKAPVHLVWSLVRRFDQPQKYKPFISRCVVRGDLEIGSVREVNVKSGLPATTSTERLELLDDNEHILSVRIVGGDHRLKLALSGIFKTINAFSMIDFVLFRTVMSTRQPVPFSLGKSRRCRPSL